MTIHEFSSEFIPKTPQNDVPFGLKEIPGVRQSAHVEDGYRTSFDGSQPIQPYTVEEFVMPGFRALDEAMKTYWSGIRVPTKESFRFMRVKIAGGDKTLLVWADDLKEGRVRLPLAAISRDSHDFNEMKFSPSYHAMGVRYVNGNYSQAVKIFRPVPFKVAYSFILWAEHKRDMEHIIFQILPRFNSLAEFRMYDGKLSGNVQLQYGGMSDASDKESGSDQQASVRYEVNMTAEAWLPLPEVLTPTVLGRPTVIKEITGDILAASRSQATGWFTP